MFQTKRSDYLYTPLFCEENIWHLADALIRQGVSDSDLHIVFITNSTRQVAVFNQQTTNAHSVVIWDYHVVLLRKTANEFLIYDFDTTAPFITPASQYLALSFPQYALIPDLYQPQFRLIESQVYLNRFSSDRSHMLGVIAANKFPDYPAIQPWENQPAISLSQCIDIDSALPANDSLFSLVQLKLKVFKP
ncbi:MAG: protein N-terminal glutamine amidohydrolase [Gammaproteobacteria bacterium]|nr:protein N-terminal glutamine amidohydrolase [Gammaproteobacteria bacterium]